MKELSTASIKKLYRLLLFVAAVAVIFIFRPDQKASSYTFQVNRPWSYGLLTAPFDVPVHIDSVSAQAIRDSLDRTFAPVYYRDKNVEDRAIAAYTKALSATPGLASGRSERSRLLSMMHRAYDTGILAPGSTTEQTTEVRMIRDNVMESHPASEYLTMREAYTLIDSMLPSPEIHRIIVTSNLAAYLQPNILPDSAATARLRAETEAKALAPVGVVQRGERIIDRGEVVTPQLYTILATYEQMKAEHRQGITADHLYKSLGALLFIITLLGSLYAFFYFFRPSFYHNFRALSMTVMIVAVFTLLAFLLSDKLTYGLYMVPFALIPILISVFLDSRTAFFSSMVAIMLSTMVARFPTEFIITQFGAVFTAMTSIKDLSRRSQIIRTAVLVFVYSGVMYVCIVAMQTGSVAAGFSGRMLMALAVNAVLISFAYVLIFLLEKVFGFVSRLTLIELTDINHPLLRELSEECPGTFQHVTAVSNLASAAADRIGANTQLVRAGALFHDIGKIANPAFFTENQHGVNPHDLLSPTQSARIVTGHVAEGIRRAEKAKLPSQIIDFIAQHHGRGKARYFYTTYCNAHPDENVDPAPFTYPGPNPLTREASIVMMADAVEAASRSLKEYTPEAISNLVNRIIDTQIAEGLHNDSPISFRDVTEIKSVFISRLGTMYHSRISYPDAVAK